MGSERPSLLGALRAVSEIEGPVGSARNVEARTGAKWDGASSRRIAGGPSRCV